ncbi:MAG TPA: hypothetical protein VIK55_01400 [Paludibacter sp.]
MRYIQKTIMFGLLLISLCFGMTNNSLASGTSSKTAEETIVFNANEVASDLINRYLNFDVPFLSESSAYGGIQKMDAVPSDEDSPANENTIDTYYESIILNIVSDLDEKTMTGFYRLSEEDANIFALLKLVESNFETVDFSEGNNASILNGIEPKWSVRKHFASFGDALTLTLASVGLVETAIVAIKAAFSIMVAAVNSWFLTPYVQAALAVAAILILTVVIVCNWNKIASIFNAIVDYFVTASGEIASAVEEVFTDIKINAGFAKIAGILKTTVSGLIGWCNSYADEFSISSDTLKVREQSLISAVSALAVTSSDTIIYRFSNNSNAALNLKAKDIYGLSFSTDFMTPIFDNYSENHLVITSLLTVNSSSLLLAKRDSAAHVSITEKNGAVNNWYTYIYTPVNIYSNQMISLVYKVW